MRKIWLSIYLGVTVLMATAQGGTHTVKAGESLYSIARTYAVKVTDIVAVNPALKDNTTVKIGQVIKLPGAAPAHAAARGIPAKVHVVAKGETFYAICKKYGVSVAEVKQWNQLTDLNLRIGQKLVVSKANSQALYRPVAVPSTPDTPYREEDVRPRNTSPVVSVPAESIKQEAIVERPKDMPLAATTPVASLRTSSSNHAEYPGIFNQYPSAGFKIKKARGAANFLLDNTTGNQFLAFYSGAETGSVIRVTNLMNKKTIYVKVMGRVPQADAANEVILKLSNTAARELGVVDEKFLVEVAAYSTQ